MKSIGALVGLFAMTCQAQEALVAVSHDRGSGVILPGETARVSMVVSWSAPTWPPPVPFPLYYTFAGLAGDLRATGDMGVASNPTSVFYYAPSPSPLTQLGTPVGGSIVGYDIAMLPPALVGTPHPSQGNWGGVNALEFDWTAPSVSQPTWIDFAFTPRTLAPNIRLYVTVGPEFVEADTTFTSARILVLPAPGVPVVLVAGLGLRRRRR